MSMIDDQETLAIFLEDSHEHLSGIENDLLAIEEAGEHVDVDLVNKVFRAIHSIKGGAGFLGLGTLKELTHSMENILNMMRTLELMPTATIVNTLLASVDVLTGMLNDPVASNEMDISAQLAALQACSTPSAAEQPPDTPDTVVPLDWPDGGGSFTVSAAELKQAQKGGKALYILTLDLMADIEAKGKTPLGFIEELQAIGDLIDSAVDVAAVGHLTQEEEVMHIPFYALFATLLEAEMITDVFDLQVSQVHALVAQHAPDTLPPAPAPEVHGASPAVAPATMPDDASQDVPSPPSLPEPMPQHTPSQKKAMAPSEASSGGKSGAGEGSLRVNVKVLDTLMTLAGELVLTRNQLVQAVTAGNAQAIDATTQRVDLVTSELQEAIMSTRMQPLGNVFNKFQRVVRDMARDLGKEVTLQITGEEVELDKTIIEGIGDPLTHLVRNAMDHGIETPEVRQQADKASNATLTLSARHEAGKVIIEVSDDGRGIDSRKIKDKAMSQGLHEQAQLDAMSESELIRLIFLPGFSMAKEVTDISGRGVGMDVVQTNLTKLGGSIDVESRIGVGSVFRIKLPLTLAIIPSQLVSVGDERYAIPQVNLQELVRVSAAQVRDRIEYIGDAMVIRLRGELLPLVHLHDVLGIARADQEDEAEDNRFPAAGKALNIVVVTAGNLHYGLIVDQLLDSEEIVVKPLGQHLQDCKIYAGATIQGDGRVALILDVIGVSAMMQLAKVGEAARDKALDQPLERANGEDVQALLLVKNAPQEQFAIPLGLVSRLEKIRKSAIATTGGRRNTKYRGGNLLLLCIEDVANVAPCADQENLVAVVFTISGQEVGLLVSQIVEVVNVEVAFDAVTFRQPGILGSAVIMEETTLLLDLYGMASEVLTDSVAPPPTAAPDEAGVKPTVLIVEDSNFFLGHVKGFVEATGYQTFTAQDGLEALEQLERHGDAIDLVLTDIEMPNLDGLGLTKRIREDARFAHLPIIALTSVAGEEAEQRGLAAGIDDYLIKLDQERLLESVAHHLRHARVA